MSIEQESFLELLRRGKVKPSFVELGLLADENIALALEKLEGSNERTKDAVLMVVGQIQRLRGEMGEQIEGTIPLDHPIHPPFSAYHGLKDWIDRLKEYNQEGIIPLTPVTPAR